MSDDPNDLDAFFTSAPSPAETFPSFWALYPRHEAKRDALKAWTQLKPDPALVAMILTDLQARAWPREKRYVLLAGTYLRGYRWTDEGATAQTGPAPEVPANRWHPTANPLRLIHGGQGVCCPHEPICATDVECWRRQQGVWTEGDDAVE